MKLVQLLRVCVDEIYLYDSNCDEIGKLHKSPDLYGDHYRGVGFNEQKYLMNRVEEIDVCDDRLMVYLKGANNEKD